MNSLAKTDVGMKRSNNEDYVFASDMPVGRLPNLYIVADGMGGYNGGEVASSEAVKAFVECVSRYEAFDSSDTADTLMAGIKAANRSVFALSRENAELSRMGTTVDGVCIAEDKIYIAHIGDSRVYLINNEIQRLTSDHSYVMDLVKAGIISKEDADRHPDKNMITRAVGVEENVECDLVVSPFKEGDYVLLCSDGLFGMISDEAIFNIVKNKNASLEDKTNMLIEEANRIGGKDNISVILVEC